MRTVFLSITHGFQARDLLQSDVFAELRAHGVRTVILTPNHDDERFRAQFGGPSVVFAPLVTTVGRAEAAFAAFRRYALSHHKLNRTVNALNEKFYKKRPFAFWSIRLLNGIFGRMPWARQAWLRLEALLFPDRDHAATFTAFPPDLIVTGTPGSIPADAHLIRRAKSLGVKTACVVLSWDNLTSKGHMAARPDHLIVWNEIMKAEAIELHDYRTEQVHVAGVSHFDCYMRRELLSSRSAFLERFQLDPERRVLVFGTVTPWLFPYNVEIADILAQAIQEDRIKPAAQLIIRLHPQVLTPGTQHSESLDRYRDLCARYPHVVLDVPAVRSGSLMWDMSSDDTLHLGSMLHHADVCLTVASTLAIDSAIFDTPIVGVAFDGHAKLPPEESIARAYDFTHYVNVMRTGSVRLARNADELVTEVNAYLAHPERDREQRARMVREQCHFTDGRSGERVGRILLALAGEPVSEPSVLAVS